ncbi:hypothetical protein RTCIAT899_PB02635 (plasmid) [Rhizobium tropici CIAT 899]|nr:hypothetical protein RTCIAT899_PB02635 [Rhizobium tropici CIAT 899]
MRAFVKSVITRAALSGASKPSDIRWRNVRRLQLRHRRSGMCSALEIAHVAFSAVAATGKIKPATVSKEGAAYAGVETICADPSHTTTVNAVVLVAQA